MIKKSLITTSVLLFLNAIQPLYADIGTNVNALKELQARAQTSTTAKQSTVSTDQEVPADQKEPVNEPVNQEVTADELQVSNQAVEESDSSVVFVSNDHPIVENTAIDNTPFTDDMISESVPQVIAPQTKVPNSVVIEVDNSDQQASIAIQSENNDAFLSEASIDLSPQDDPAEVAATVFEDDSLEIDETVAAIPSLSDEEQAIAEITKQVSAYNKSTKRNDYSLAASIYSTEGLFEFKNLILERITFVSQTAAVDLEHIAKVIRNASIEQVPALILSNAAKSEEDLMQSYVEHSTDIQSIELNDQNRTAIVRFMALENGVPVDELSTLYLIKIDGEWKVAWRHLLMPEGIQMVTVQGGDMSNNLIMKLITIWSGLSEGFKEEIATTPWDNPF